MQIQKTLQLPNSLSKLHHIRRAVRKFLGIKDNESFVTKVILAVDEALSNVIEHGYPEQRKSAIYIQMEKTPKKIRFSIYDDGIQYDPYPKRDRKGEISKSGYGLDIIHSLMEVKYIHHPVGINVLELSKDLESSISKS